MKHIPVLLDECIRFLNIKPEGIYIDATLGRGGHSLEIAKRLAGNGRLIAIDRDEEAVSQAKENLKEFERNITLVKGNFENLPEIMDSQNVEKADGILFDFGVSSPQLDDISRGFSYMKDTALDMRMDKQNGLTAYDIVNTWSYEEILEILREYGEEKFAKNIAREIVKYREGEPIKSTFALNEIVSSAIPAFAKRDRGHPSKRSFQAIRIAVNDELGAIRRCFAILPERLKPSARMCAISFHSLEDRIVKRFIQTNVSGCICPNKLPVCACGFSPSMKLITKRPILPQKSEISVNARAKSAKLRVAERV
jgi:16S rRNA (cytosine1402-N4)-methyltransferase